MKKIILITGLMISMFSCQNKSTSTEMTQENSIRKEQWKGFTKVKPTEITDNVIQLIGKEWMLITAGNKDSFNTMTASWGGFGEIWNKPVSLITVRDVRYTYQFIESNEYYTLAFFPEKYKNKLTLLGTKSGRDSDKIAESGLTPVETPAGSMAFTEARMIVECRKLYADPMKKEAFIDKSILNEHYGEGNNSMHTIYVGEIVNVWVKD